MPLVRFSDFAPLHRQILWRPDASPHRSCGILAIGPSRQADTASAGHPLGPVEADSRRFYVSDYDMGALGIAVGDTLEEDGWPKTVYTVQQIVKRDNTDIWALVCTANERGGVP